jgi:hypothetical protein
MNIIYLIGRHSYSQVGHGPLSQAKKEKEGGWSETDSELAAHTQSIVFTRNVYKIIP